jgi:hypothetical protein
MTVKGANMLVNVTEVIRDEGTVVVFAGQETGTGIRSIHFAVDHRLARDLIEAIADGEDGEAPLAEVEEWQILGEF